MKPHFITMGIGMQHYQECKQCNITLKRKIDKLRHWVKNNPHQKIKKYKTYEHK